MTLALSLTYDDLLALLATPGHGGHDRDDVLDLIDEFDEVEEEEEEDGDEDDDDGDDDGGGRSSDDDRIARIVTRETRKAAKAARRSVLESLGFQSEDEAKSFAEAARKRQQENEDEATRRQREADEREARAVDRERKANEKAVRADVRAALLDAGVNPDRMDRATRNVLADLGDDLSDVDDDSIVEAVTTLAEKDSPEWFTSRGEGDEDDERRKRKPAGGALPDRKRKDGARAGVSALADGEARALAEIKRRRELARPTGGTAA